MPKKAAPLGTSTPPKSFTVIGFWPDTEQRFADIFRASSASMAEQLCLRSHPGIAVCGVIAGSHACLDTSPYLALG
jgi:hypothetical protein